MNPQLEKPFRFIATGGFFVLIILAGYTAGTMKNEEAHKAILPNIKYASLDASNSPLQGIVEDAFAAIGGTITNSGNLLVTGFLDVRGNIQDGGTVIYNTGTNKIEQAVLPFNQGDLIAPGDRPLISGLGSYFSSYFNIGNLGISGTSASNVRSGVAFGPGNAITGTYSGGGILAIAKVGFSIFTSVVYYHDAGCSSNFIPSVRSMPSYSEYDPQGIVSVVNPGTSVKYLRDVDAGTCDPITLNVTDPTVSCSQGTPVLFEDSGIGSDGNDDGHGCGGNNGGSATRLHCHVYYCSI